MLEQLTATASPVTLATLKASLRIDGTAEDALLAGYLLAAAEYVGGLYGITRRSLAPTAWRLTLPAVAGRILLPCPPVAAVSSVEYYSDGVLTALDPAAYRLIRDDARPFLEPAGSWPLADERSDAVQVTYAAGYVVVPQLINQAILVHAGASFANRGDGDVPGHVLSAVDALVTPLRIAGVGL